MNDLLHAGMRLCTRTTACVIALCFQEVVADLFDSNIPSRQIFNLDEILVQADIAEDGDINSDAIADYIIRYKDSASGYGEFLYNVIISDGARYRRGFGSDDYFVELHFQEGLVVGTRRDGATTTRQYRYFYDAVRKVLEEQ